MQALPTLLKILPKNATSYATGVAARLRLPRPLARYTCEVFARTFRLDMAEAALPLGAYRTIEEVFTRRLKEGARSAQGPVCSPADGYLARSEPADGDRAVQAKGLEYSLLALTGASADASFGWYFTVYLAPHNYHRVHAPVTGLLEAVTYVPGRLWPVNATFVALIPRLFVANERLIFTVALPEGGRVYIVMVGAFNVGRMEATALPGFVTNATSRQWRPQGRTHVFSTPVPLALGDELGVFMLGSTVVVAFDEAASRHYRFVQSNDGRPILMGQSLAELRGMS